MSLAARRTVLVASRSRPAFSTQRGAASSASHDHQDHDHHHEQDSTVYPAESFGGRFWRNVVLVSIAGAVGLKYAPEPSENVYLTRWIAMYTAPRDYWLSLNAKHTAQQEEYARVGLLVNDAQRPPVHRFRYPQMLDQASAFLVPVGSDVDVSSVVPRT
ncbi:hypothetical protein NLJ89_g6705 [Agrocybe chaxingu]|uniref:Uncharacterized protein n=1 Tax=Agrocybe chaxingu TaxID=84603 RepID=A0A9W8JYN9_9AGAR|nr:hypothetical protein NLJ89_g6705 [Agrocybe chaxingu]